MEREPELASRPSSQRLPFPNHDLTQGWGGGHGLLALGSYDGSMSRTKIVALVVLGIVVPFVLAFSAYNLSRTIGSPGVPPVPGLVHRQDDGAKTEPSKGRTSPGSGQSTSANQGSGSTPPQVDPTPTDDHGGRDSDGSGSSGPGSGDDSSNSGSSGSSGSGGSGGSGSDEGSGGGSGDD